MKIAYFSSSHTSSGGTRQALCTALELQKLGHELIFFIPSNSSIINKSAEIKWVKLPTEIKKWKQFFFNHILDFKPHIVHAFHNKAVKKIAWWSIFAKRKFSFVCLAHRGVIFRPHNPLPYWSPGIDCYTANSKACAQKIAQMGVPQKKLKLYIIAFIQTE